ncbi:hypothetical protein DBT_0342 [Dissulfuribacter thermophilus]|uniref:Uncharacterized protein n=1 Tax=Dissulfuribacter thermophilus TaxID=1156395 RepID=A0A1B9F9I9_9BACT|nr:hypothetical protein DBT_0342 [Dissulfuribacter thermophilus]
MCQTNESGSFIAPPFRPTILKQFRASAISHPSKGAGGFVIKVKPCNSPNMPVWAIFVIEDLEWI